ncbi:MAG: serine/threonine-protein kinase, partial [Polyangiaceae bacterium]
MLPAEGEKVLPAEAGSTFGKYQLFATLGRGGMADVFLAVARGPMGFNKLAVVKRLRTALSEEPAFLSMFLDEARLAARLSHPNIVHTYEVGEESSSYFIAMEYLEGQPLNKIIKEAAKTQKKVDPALAARLVADALHGLHHAHELKDYDGTPLRIIHRDVSPHNIFVTYDGIVKLVDFGIAKAALSSTHTEVGVLKGKVAYMAPEQAVGGAVDRRADLFAMGIVLWELLTRRRLMTGDTAAATLHRLVSLPVPRVSDALPDVDPKLDAIVAKALEKDPAKRFQTAAEMRDALEAFAMTSGTARTEDVGALVVDMFGTVRADVQKQIQAHMAKV